MGQVDMGEGEHRTGRYEGRKSMGQVYMGRESMGQVDVGGVRAWDR